MDDTEYQRSDASTRTKLLLTIEEAASMLSLGRTHFYAMVMRNEIMSIKLGRTRRIPVFALQDFVTRRIAESERAS